MNLGLKVRYIHADVDAVERVEILRALRLGEFDILIGINLLREGLDLPEVSLVCVLDADKEGYLRSATSLIQTAGRAARHVNGEVVLFADIVTGSIQQLLDATSYRRHRQMTHNEENDIVPTSVVRGMQQSLQLYRTDSSGKLKSARVGEEGGGYLTDSKEDVQQVLKDLQAEMIEASNALEFERAALLRDQIAELKKTYG